MSKPGWMNGSLEEEWIEQDEAQDMSIAHDDDAERSPIQDQDEGVALTRSTRSSQDSGTSATAVSESEQQGGTFLVREDVLHEPVTPAKRLVGMKGKANPLTKSFFSPLALEKMFEPPSPPLQKSNGARVPSRLSESHVPERIPSRRGPGPSDSQANDQPRVDEIVDSDLPDVVRSVDFRPDTYHSFTFQTPIASPSPVSHSTPAEPPLRLFQTYDTYTKDHLYALANSIDVKSTVDSPSEDGYIRHSKRIKLSAPDDLIEGSSRSSPRARRSSVTPPSRPSSRRDYLGESRSLMQQIREHRSLSLATTVPSDAAPLSIVEEKDEEAQLSEGNISRSVSDHWKDENYVTSPARGASSQAYRLQAASLMAQIRSEVHEDMPNESLRFGMANLSLRDDSVRNVAVLGTMPQRHPTRSDDASPSAPRNRTASLGSASRPSRILVNGDIANTTPTIRLEPNSPTEPIPPQNQDDLILLSTPPQEAQPLVVDSLRPSDGTPSTSPSNVPAGTQSQVQQDVARFVMTGTAQSSVLQAAAQRSHSGTSTASNATGVKHAGPSHGGVIRTIAPGDVGPIEQVGDMVWDAEHMRWTKLRSGKRKSPEEDLSEDVFRDIESLKDATELSHVGTKAARFDSDTESSDSGMEGCSESMIDAATRPDASRSLVGNENTPHGGFDGGSDREDVGTSTADHTTALTETTRTEATCGSYTYDLLRRNFETLSDGEEEERLQPSEAPQSTPQPVPRPILIPSQSTPHPFPHPHGKVRPSIPLVPPKSVLKQTATPALTSKGSLVKQASVGPSTPLPSSAQRSHRRSVSFSDGRTDGKIVGLVSETDSSEGEGSISMAERQSGKNASFAHSLRTKRIDNMLAQLEQESLEDWQTPSKSNPSSHLPDISNIIPLSARSSAFTKSTQEESVAVKASGHNDKTPKAQPRKIVAPRSKRTLSLQAQANQTILTECSFAVSQDRLIQAITQVHPYEPHWEHLPQIDLSNLKIESITKMKDFLPSLVSLDLHNNQISYLTGIPSNVRQLRVSDNLLTSVTVYSHLRNLESLDISNNSIDSLSQLEFLPLLRDLHADGNSISTIDGLQHASALTKLSLQRNKLTQLNLRTCDWSRLEHLDLSYNRLTAVSGVTTLTGLVSLNLDHNLLDSLSCSSIVARLRILRLSYNRVSEINAAPFVNLRTLYMDGNRLKRLIHMDRLSKLENLSLRNQMGGKLHLLPADVRDVKRLYLSGNPLEDLTFLSVPCYNLLYLELAGCRISVLPDALAASIPNIRVLNLNYNFVSDVRPIQDLTRLKRLTLVGSRLKGTKRILMGLRKMPDLEMVDLRMNPVTLGWYLPLLVRDAPAVLQPSEAASAFPPLLGLGEGGQSDASDHSAVRLYPYSTNSRRARNIPSEDNSRARKRAVEPSWEDLDAKFRRDLPNDSYLGRLAYRGMVMRACPKVQVIDGVRVTEPERKKAETLLQNVLDSRG